MGVPTTTTPYFMWPANRNGDDDDQMMMMRKADKKKKKRNKYGGIVPEKKNKQPQRGLGVAQLEKLRLQERWKKMACTTSSSSGLFYSGGGDIFDRVNSTPVGYLPIPQWLGNQRSQMMINNIIPYVQSNPSSSTPTTETTFGRNYSPFLSDPPELSSNQKNITHHHNHHADSCSLKVMAPEKKGKVVREYQLFPCGNYDGSESDITASNQNDDAGEWSNYAPSKHNTPIDLTLKLNSY